MSENEVEDENKEFIYLEKIIVDSETNELTVKIEESQTDIPDLLISFIYKDVTYYKNNNSIFNKSGELVGSVIKTLNQEDTYEFFKKEDYNKEKIKILT
jgi:hypothetical protein